MKSRSGPIGISAKSLDVKKVISRLGPVTITATKDAKVGTVDNSGEKQKRTIKIGNLTLFSIDTGFSFFDSLLSFLKRK